MEKQYKITLVNKGVIYCDSYEERPGGIFWVRGTIQGYMTNDQWRKVQEIETI